MKLRQTLLFVPGDRPDRIAKAAKLPADAIVIDLEDAVAPEHKSKARELAATALADLDFGPREVIVRVNRIATPAGLADLLALLDWPRKPDALMLPKAESAAEIQIYAAILAGAPGGPLTFELLPLIESSRGVANAASIAAASPLVTALLFGGADLSADLGCKMAWEPLLAHRSTVVLAASLAGISAIDVPFLGLADPEGLVEETTRARDLGFTGKLCIHPNQLEPVASVFAPTQAEIERAHRVLAAVQTQGQGAIQVDGRMVDLPVIRMAERVLARVRSKA